MEKYTEIFKLAGKLAEAEIPFEWLDWSGHSLSGGYAIYYYKNGEYVAEAIQYENTDSKKNIFEFDGELLTEKEKTMKIVDFLSAEEVFNRIKKHWEESK